MAIKKPSKQLTALTLFLEHNYRDRARMIQEFQFHPPRRWRFDFAFPGRMVAIEYEGGLYRAGGGFHQSISLMQKNMEKYNRAALDGWLLLRVCAKTIDTGAAYLEIEEALKI